MGKALVLLIFVSKFCTWNCVYCIVSFALITKIISYPVVIHTFMKCERSCRHCMRRFSYFSFGSNGMLWRMCACWFHAKFTVDYISWFLVIKAVIIGTAPLVFSTAYSCSWKPPHGVQVMSFCYDSRCYVVQQNCCMFTWCVFVNWPKGCTV